MITRLYSATLRGVDAREVEVEVNARGADRPLVIIVGLPDAAVRESSQRVTSAISASALYLDDGVKTVNLAPADLKKEGPSFDLPIALAMVAAGRQRPFNADDCCVVGELGLDGTVRAVKGVLAIALEAKRCGRARLLVPEANAREAAVIEGIEVFPIRNLNQAWKFLDGEEDIAPYELDRQAFFNSRRVYDCDFDEVKGQHHVKRALEVAAAGGHNVLIILPFTTQRIRGRVRPCQTLTPTYDSRPPTRSTATASGDRRNWPEPGARNPASRLWRTTATSAFRPSGARTRTKVR